MVPTFEKFLYPALLALKDGKECKISNVFQSVISYFKFSQDDLSEKLKSGNETKVHNRVQWATTYLQKAGLINKPQRGICVITKDGLALLKGGLTDITQRFLIDNYPSFRDFARGNRAVETEDKHIVDITSETPYEALERNVKLMKQELADELLQVIKSKSPKFFEQLVLDLLLKMGYGGQSEENAFVTQYSNDEGIDGIIKEDKLGLDNIYVQAKRYDGIVVGRPEIQKFVGALAGQGANKGVFITTSSFSKDARSYKPQGTAKIVLIEGIELCNYMIEYNLGVSVKDVYEVKRIDTDYFSEE